MRDAKIEDIDSIRDLMAQAKAVKAVGKIAKIAGGAVKLVGRDPTRLQEFAARADELSKEAATLSQLPDRFNARFAQRGWIAYDSLSVPVATRALELADAGDLPGAEQLLADSIDETHLKFQLLRLRSIKAFFPRLRLAELAATDYIEGRYHASVPVVLLLLDGFVNDLGDLGFFAEKTELEAWDSVAAHISGLPELKKLMNTQRKTTRTEEITVPFRHGILHGNDLGYANKLVAAKCWAALFATAEWARKQERDTDTPQGRVPTPTLRASLKSLAETQRTKRLLAEWKPREVGVGEPAADTPEFVVTEFLQAWQRRNYGQMANFVPRQGRNESNGKIAGRISPLFRCWPLAAFNLLTVEDVAPCRTKVTVHRQFLPDTIPPMGGSPFTYSVVHVDEDGVPVFPQQQSGRWIIMNHAQ